MGATCVFTRSMWIIPGISFSCQIAWLFTWSSKHFLHLLVTLLVAESCGQKSSHVASLFLPWFWIQGDTKDIRPSAHSTPFQMLAGRRPLPCPWVDILTVAVTYWCSFMLALVFCVCEAQGACELGSEIPEEKKNPHHHIIKWVLKVGSFPSPHATMGLLPRDSQAGLPSSIPWWLGWLVCCIGKLPVVCIPQKPWHPCPRELLYWVSAYEVWRKHP